MTIFNPEFGFNIELNCKVCMVVGMRLIALIFLMIVPSFVLAERRWVCIGEELAHTNFNEGSKKYFDFKPQDAIYMIRLMENSKQIEITLLGEPSPEPLTDCIIKWQTSFQCNATDDRGAIFYFDYIAGEFMYFLNRFASGSSYNHDSYMIGGYCKDFK